MVGEPTVLTASAPDQRQDMASLLASLTEDEQTELHRLLSARAARRKQVAINGNAVLEEIGKAIVALRKFRDMVQQASIDEQTQLMAGTLVTRAEKLNEDLTAIVRNVQ